MQAINPSEMFANILAYTTQTLVPCGVSSRYKRLPDKGSEDAAYA